MNGQTKRATGTRFKEYITSNCYWRLESSGIVQRINDTEHNINISNIELIKGVNLARKLRKYKTIYIRKDSNILLNREFMPFYI